MFARFNSLYEGIRPHLLPLMLLVMAVGAVYARMLDHQFLSNWDDNRYVLENADIQGFGLDRLKAVFTTYYVGNYAPVHMLSYMLDYALWGLRPGGYLLVNMLLHMANGLLLYRLLLQLIGGRGAAFFGAAVFLLHPVQVESVAWISQRKNLLAMFFFLLAWECYRFYRDSAGQRRRLWYVASVVALLAALLTKSVAVIFPVVVLLFDYCYPATVRRISLLDKLPYLLAAAAVAVVAVLSQTPDYQVWGAGGGRSAYHGGSAVTTFFSMIPVLCLYLRMLVWPAGLSVYYTPTLHPYPDRYVIMASLLLTFIAWLIFRMYRQDRRLAFWPLLFFIGLLPVLQIIPMVTMINDRYLYFPLLGVAGIVAGGMKLLHEKSGRRSIVYTGVPAILLLLLALVSFNRVPVWKNALTIWKDTVTKVPEFFQAWEALGEAFQYYNAAPDYDEAAKAFLRALELKPENGISWYNLGVAYTEQKKYVDADAAFKELLRRQPQNVMGWTAFGELALRQQKYAEAEQRYRKALSLQPEALQIHNRIGNLLVITGRIDEARKTYLEIEAIDGGYDARNAYDLARVEAISGDTGASVRWLETALQRGYNDFAGILADEALLPVLADGRFASLVDKYFPQHGKH